MNCYKKALVLGLIIFAIIALRYSGITLYVNFESLKAHREQLLVLVKGSYLISIVLYILAYILVAAFSLPIVVPLTLIGGFLLEIHERRHEDLFIYSFTLMTQ